MFMKSWIKPRILWKSPQKYKRIGPYIKRDTWAKITLLRSAAKFYTWQKSIGPSSGLSNEKLCIFSLHGAAKLPDVKVGGLKTFCSGGSAALHIFNRVTQRGIQLFFLFANHLPIFYWEDKLYSLFHHNYKNF